MPVMEREAPPARDERYVVVHEGLGAWKRGDVISRSDIEAGKGDVMRLLAGRAMRSATDLEWGQRHVDLPSEQAQLSYQHEMAQRDQEIARLRLRVAELEEVVAAGRAVVQADNGRAVAELVGEKDKLILSKDQVINARDQELREMRAKLQQAAASRGQAAPAPPAPG